MFDENDDHISNPRQTMIQMTEYSDNILDSPQLCASSRSVNIWDQSRVRCGDMIKDKGHAVKFSQETSIDVFSDL